MIKTTQIQIYLPGIPTTTIGSVSKVWLQISCTEVGRRFSLGKNIIQNSYISWWDKMQIHLKYCIILI